MSSELQTTTGPATLIPFGLGSTHPIQYRPVFNALITNRHAIGASWSILREAPCLQCATSGYHICPKRLDHLHRFHQPAIVPYDLRDHTHLQTLSPDELLDLGHLDTPWMRDRQGFRRIGWEEALRRAAPTTHGRWYPAANGLSDETLWAIHDCATTLAHTVHLAAPDPSAASVGWNTATTDDLLEAQLVLLWGTELHRTAPDLLRILAQARTQGARVLWFHHNYDAAMEAHRFPNTFEAALFGSRSLDGFTLVAPDGLGALAQALRDETVGREVLETAGVHRGQLQDLTRTLAGQQRVVSLWDEHLDTEAINAVIALHEHHGWTGTASGFLPLPAGPSLLGARAVGISWSEPAEADWCAVFGNATPGPASVRVHVDTHLRPAMLEPADEVILLPVQHLLNQRGGAWITTADARIRSLPTIGEAEGVPAWAVPSRLLAAARPEHAGDVPSTIDHLRQQLMARPTHRHTGQLKAGGWARIPRI